MIVANAKSAKASSSSSPLSLSVPKEKPTLSFSDLLRGAGDNRDAKVVQNGSLILSLGSEEKSPKTVKNTSIKKVDSLGSILKSEEKSAPLKTQEPLELNPKLTAVLTKVEIKELISEAKNYLKAKIQESEGYKKAEIKELPNTLKGLVEVAKKFGIDIGKISFEEVRTHSQKVSRGEVVLNKKTTPEKEIKAEAPKEAKVEVPKEAKVDTPKEIKAEIPKEIKAEASKEAKIEMPKEAKVEASKEIKAEIQKEAKIEMPKEAVLEKKSQAVQSDEKQKNVAIANVVASKIEQNETKIDEKVAEVQKEAKFTPLFKAQAVIEHTSTEQIVQVKANTNSFKAEQKTPKERADETLKLLLRGEKPSVSNPVLTADFSVATAKVIAPTATSESSKTLEHLLHGEPSSSEQNPSSKIEALAAHKADSFEVKLNEAKQMIRYLSADVKGAIEDYRSPFTRVKLQLNPQNLGEVDLTVVQRGKNLHVNITSNNTAINTLSMNVNELRVQLNNNGINNATLNFSNGGQNSDTNAGGGHQQRHSEQRAHEEYGYFEVQEANEEILSSLEIIVPRYI